MSSTRAILARDLPRTSWGSWKYDSGSLTYEPPSGEPTPAFDVTVVDLDRAKIERWIEHLSVKNWATESVLSAFRAACKDLLAAQAARARREFENEYATDAPPPMPSDEYHAYVHRTWDGFLKSANPNDEGVFQTFLEEHPCLLPEVWTLFGGGHHSPHLGGFITQPELPGLRAKRPDFMVIAIDSETVTPLLIELEAPAKPWVTKGGVQAAQLTAAIDQIREWQTWFSEPEHVALFRKAYSIEGLMRCRQLEPRYVLIYGRRADAQQSEVFAKKRASLSHHNECIMTYDRLSPGHRNSSALTIRLDRSDTETRFRGLFGRGSRDP